MQFAYGLVFLQIGIRNISGVRMYSDHYLLILFTYVTVYL
jgi:hypothetical protein